MTEKIRICHLTSVHKRNDPRVFIKECTSLLDAGYDVSLIVADGLGDAEVEGVRILDAGKESSRLKRIMRAPRNILRRAREIDALLFHFHDPELIPAGLKLLQAGKTVIYDSHEDVPRQLLGKPYLNRRVRSVVSRLFEWYENRAAKKFSGIITATPHIRDRFLKINKNTVDINNFPILNELYSEIDWKDRKNQICYIGRITVIRGIEQVIDSMEHIDNRLLLAGTFDNDALKKNVAQRKGWKNVEELGFVSREEAREILASSKAGIVTFLPQPNHLDAQPNKMFEYMAAGIPVIASDFPFWKGIIEKHNCGICVNPLDPEDIARAIHQLLSDDALAEELGKNGRKAILEKYNWQVETPKLGQLYEDLTAECGVSRSAAESW